VIPEYYKAATDSAALAEMDWFGTVKLSGPDRVNWLQGMVTNDVQKLKPGTGCYAAHLTPQGKIVAQMHILADDDALWLSLERAAIPNLLSAFDKLLIMEDVQVEDVSNDYSVLAVMGPKALAVIESWAGEPLNLTDKYAHRNFEDCRVLVSDLGYQVWVPRGKADKVLRFLADSGATAIDHGTWDVLRTELGIPVYGVDIDETTTMPEIGEAGISYEKGCYIGQEVVAKVKYIGHINRRFAGLTFSGAELPQLKSAIRKGGREVGYITTALFSPALNKPIALGFVSRVAYVAGTEVAVVSGETALNASVVELPFKSPKSA
jgi:folate-binding protein YgfZ